MSSVDSRIVTMKFDNTQFQQGAAQTMSTFEKMKSTLNFSTLGSAASKGLGLVSSTLGRFGLSFGRLGTTAQRGMGIVSSALSKIGIKNPFATTTQGIQSLQTATNGFNTSSMTGQVTHISKAFVAMAAVSIAAISRVTNRVISAGANLASAFSTDPIKQGYGEYVTNLNSIQTILANTRASGAKLSDVNAALQQLNHYSDKTIYNFSEMARNIGTFTAAGVDLKTSVASIKGIANLAAVSGSNSQQASTAMYQLSQAISAGRVSLQDWNSVVNAGMGGTVFQRALAQTAQSMGTLSDGSVKLTGKMKNVSIAGQSFRQSITAKPGETSWLTSKVLTNTLQQFTGDLSKADLKAQGFNDSQIKAIQATAKNAQEAATKVKSLGQVFDVAKETIGSGWSKTFQLIFGNFTQARTTFTELSNTFNSIINRSSRARNQILGEWSKLGGRNELIEGFKNLGSAFVDIITPIKEAFRDIFPKETGTDLYNLTVAFRKFAEGLTISDTTANNLYRTFKGVFAVFDIVKQVIGGVAHGLGILFGAVSSGSGGFLNFTGGLGDMLVAFDKMLRKSGIITGFFTGLAHILSLPLHIIGVLAKALGQLFSGLDLSGMDKLSGAINDVSSRLSPLEKIGAVISAIFGKIGDAIAKAGPIIANGILHIGDAISNSISPETFGSILDAVNTGLLAGLVLMLKHFLSGGVKVDVGGGIFSKIRGSLDQLTGTLKSMQQSLQASTMLKIAGAIAVLAAALLVLSTIDPKRLSSAIIAMATSFGLLEASLVVLSKTMKFFGAAKIAIVSASLILLSFAILELAVALKIMASMSWSDIAKGLATTAALLGILSVATSTLGKASGGILRASVAMVALGIGLNLMAVALKVMASMSWAEMAKGLITMGGALLIIAGAMDLMPNMLLKAAGLIALGAALNIIAVALAVMGAMSWSAILKSLVELAGALTIIAIAIDSLGGPLLPLIGAGLVLVAAGLAIMSGALKVMGGMSWSEIAKSLVELAASLAILAAGLYLMTGAIVGAAALLVAAAALAVLVPVLLALSTISWTGLLKAMVALAATFTILGVAGLLLGPLTPVLLGLGAALLLIGAGFALAGAGALAVASAFAIFVAAGAAGVVMVTALLKAVISKIGSALKAVGHGIVLMAKEVAKGGKAFTQAFTTIMGSALRAIVKNAPKMVKAFGVMVSSLVKAVIKNTPKMARAFVDILDAALRVVRREAPNFVRTGFSIFMAFLRGVASHIEKIVQVATTIIVRFINGLSKNMPRIVQAGFNLIVRFINGLTNAINRNSGRLGTAGGNLAWAIVRGMVSGLGHGASAITNAALGAARSALNAAKNLLGIHSPSTEFMKIGMFASQGFAIGIETHAKSASNAAENMGKDSVSKMKASMRGLSDAISSNVDTRPVITPVLDLTDVHKGARDLNKMVDANSIRASVSLGQASDISARASAEQASASEQPAPVVKEISLVQNNYSPTELSPVKIYRQTRNQLAMAREALTE